MPQQLPPYHINEQRADALLQPIALGVGELAARATHYLERLTFTYEDRATIEAAQAALATASAELDRLWRSSLATPRK